MRDNNLQMGSASNTFLKLHLFFCEKLSGFLPIILILGLQSPLFSDNAA